MVVVVLLAVLLLVLAFITDVSVFVVLPTGELLKGRTLRKPVTESEKLDEGPWVMTNNIVLTATAVPMNQYFAPINGLRTGSSGSFTVGNNNGDDDISSPWR